MSDTDDYDLIDIYAEDVDKMDADVTTAVALQLIAGTLVTPNLILFFNMVCIISATVFYRTHFSCLLLI